MRDLLIEVSSGLRALSWQRFPYVRFGVALAIGLLGAWTFLHFRLPLPWMLGPLSFCTVAVLLRLPAAAPTVIRPPMTAIVGVMLGSAFTPQVLDHAASWVMPLAGLVVFLIVGTFSCMAYLRIVGRLDPITAYYAGTPGGLSDMVLLADQHGADFRTVALIHACRIIVIVFALPFILQYGFGADFSARAGLSAARAGLEVMSLVWLIGTAIVGTIVGYYLRLPAKALLGSMLVSGLLHITGISSSTPPTVLLNAAQLVLGATIGCRFVGVRARDALSAMTLAFGSAVVLLVLTFGCAYVVNRISGHGIVPLVLAYSPGGLTEMSLLALALHIEIAFVAAHHLVRIFLVIAGAAGLSRVFIRRGMNDDE